MGETRCFVACSGERRFWRGPGAWDEARCLGLWVCFPMEAVYRCVLGTAAEFWSGDTRRDGNARGPSGDSCGAAAESRPPWKRGPRCGVAASLALFLFPAPVGRSRAQVRGFLRDILQPSVLRKDEIRPISPSLELQRVWRKT